MRKLFKALQKDERGVSALEYAILAGIIVVAIVAGLNGFKDEITKIFSNTTKELQKVSTPSTTPTNPSN